MLRVLICGGGTGGHVFPAIAIADAIRTVHPQTEFLFVGATGRMEMERVPAAGYKIEGLPMVGFPRKPSLSGYFRFVKAWITCRRHAKVLVREFSPDVAIGVGGYASVPAMQAAARMGVPTLLQEQNGYAGRANRLLARRAEAVCVAFEGMERDFPHTRLVFTGNPIRAIFSQPLPPAAEARGQFGIHHSGTLLLAMGGSLGARPICKALIEALPRLHEAGIHLLLQTGKANLEWTKELAKGAPAREALTIVDFIADMPAAYAAADIIVSRAGAVAISELCLIAKPLILVPSPHVAEDHQTKNANHLVARKAALLVPQERIAEELAERILSLEKDQPQRQAMHEGLRSLARPTADEHIARIAIEIAKAHE